MLVLEEFEKLLLDYLVVVCAEGLCQALELSDGILNEDLGGGILDKRSH